MRFRGPLTLTIALALAGCQLGQPLGAKSSPKPGPRTTAKPSAGPLKADFAPLVEARRPIDPADLTGKTKLVGADIVGKAKLISDHGSGIISNNTGGLLSNNSAGLISDHGSGLVSNNSGNLTGKTKYALAQDPGPAAESLLAEAAVEVLDGDGKVLVGPDDRPLGATTDATGAFRFSGQLPDENLVLRVRLYNGGALLALLPRATAAGPRTVDLDTAASLGAAYVLETFVQKRAAVYAKLPAAEAEALRGDLEAARAHLPAGARSYKLQDLVAATAAISAKAPPVAERLEKIKALLVAGQANLGEGRPAREVSLSTPSGVAVLADGAIVVSESSAGRLRRISPDLRAGLYAGQGMFFDGRGLIKGQGEFLESPADLLALPDGSLLISDAVASRVRKLTPDGRIATILGTGQRAQGSVGGLGTVTSLQGPRALALGPDGSIYVVEVPKINANGRIIRLKPDGLTEEIAGPPGWSQAEVPAIAVAADGAIWVGESRGKTLHRRAPDGTWRLIDADAGTGDFSDYALTPGGDLIATAFDGHRIYRYDAAGARTVVAGTGVAGYAGDGGPATAAQINRPAGLWLGPDGRIVFVESGNAIVREIRKDGTIATLAGAAASDVVGDATAIAINSPAGIAIDGQGRLVIAEAAGDTIKRLEGGRLVKIAGAGEGFGGDGGPALQARFNTIGGLAYAGDDLYVLDTVNERLRKIDAAGVVTTVAGAIDGSIRELARIPARMLSMGRPLSVAVGPDKLPYWTDNQENKVYRLAADGMVEVVAGILVGDVGDAPDAPSPAVGGGLSNPIGVAFDAAGDLYVCDSGNLKIRKITGLATGNFVMSTWAGTGFAGALDLFGGVAPADEGKPKEEAVFIGPSVLTFGPDGACYVAEAGTLKLATLGGMTGMDTSKIPTITARIRRIAPDGTVRTVAGPGSSVLADPASDDTLITPLGLIFDGDGRLVVSDSGTNQVKVIPKGAF